ncbi:hypothetical protein [Candidatus Pelagibacter sp. Uisw_134_02]|jgi:hypothetical protein|uniref:hypothetical protein n=1 Tax=Candidatus Pelagibacter sp. Uisw_134_02 TaxID=3230990 RepID=UPI0039EC2989|tara:strand:- start:314 stop:490 length:177 start_codon:yes stop_codon:yes gene_type:complete
MQFSKNTSRSSNIGLLIKVFLILTIVFGAIAILGKIEFPSPKKDIEKIISNEKLKIVK